MDTFALAPEQSGYTFQPSNVVLEQALHGGFARQRRSFINNVQTVSATVKMMSKAHAQYFWAFWRVHTLNPKPFLWLLITDSHELQVHECQFIPSSISVSDRRYIVYDISFQVRCKPLNNNNLELDQTIVDLWYGGNGDEKIELLEKLTNIYLADALENLP